jgi:hypothetical protein
MLGMAGLRRTYEQLMAGKSCSQTTPIFINDVGDYLDGPAFQGAIDSNDVGREPHEMKELGMSVRGAHRKGERVG